MPATDWRARGQFGGIPLNVCQQPPVSFLRVLHVIASMAAEGGGPPAVCAGLTAALAARAHHVTVATLEEPGHTPVTLDARVELKAFASERGGHYGKSAALDAWLKANVTSFDIVHLHAVWLFPTFAAARACWAQRKPYVVLLHGMLDQYSVRQHSLWLKRAYWLLRERRVEGRAAGIQCLNRAEMTKAVPWIGNMPKFILPNGIDESQIAAMPARGAFRAAHPDLAPRPLALFLSRLHPKKGLDRLLPAWKALADRMPEARLLIAGTGEPGYVESLKKLAADSGLAEKVVFLGQLVGRQKWEALVDANVFVLPSHQEGFSMAITEALAAGCPPVVTEECNFDELAEEKACGVIIQGGDMRTFVEVAKGLLADGEKRQMLAAAGRDLVAARFTWQKIACELEQVYRRILAGERLPPNP
jgi:glycosyltransferase involved in cell wall biosynthesis